MISDDRQFSVFVLFKSSELNILPTSPAYVVKQKVPEVDLLDVGSFGWPSSACLIEKYLPVPTIKFLLSICGDKIAAVA